MQNAFFKDPKSSLTASSTVSHVKPENERIDTNKSEIVDVKLPLETKEVNVNSIDSTTTNVPDKSITSTEDTTVNSIKSRLGYDSETSESEDGDSNIDIVEESPNGRWVKRTEKVNQRDIPGINKSYLAMDNDTGNEVVWNEVLFSEVKNFKQKQHIIRQIFDNLAQLRHANLVRFHDHWTDGTDEKPRIVFITEYMSSGCMARFLHRTRVLNNSGLSIKSWKAWCTQILSALNYLHSCLPSVVHGNLNINTIFFQQNGKIKIGGVTPYDIKIMLNSLQNNIKYLHYLSPENYQNKESTIESDIYSFGICALEMAVHKGLIDFARSLNPENSSPVVDQDIIQKALDSLEDDQQKDFIKSCLKENPKDRESVRKLLFHPVLFKIHPLKLLAAHKIVKLHLNEDLPSEHFQIVDVDRIAATSKFREMSYGDVAACQQDLEKFIKDVKNDVYPMTTFPTFEQPTKLKKIVFDIESIIENTTNSEDHDDSRSTDGLNISSPRPTSSKTSNSPTGRDIISPDNTITKGLDVCSPNSRPLSPENQLSPSNTVKGVLPSDNSSVSKSKFSIERFSTEPSPPPTVHKAASQPPEICDSTNSGFDNPDSSQIESNCKTNDESSNLGNNTILALNNKDIPNEGKPINESKKIFNVTKVVENTNNQIESQEKKIITNNTTTSDVKSFDSEPKKKQFVVIKVSTKNDDVSSKEVTLSEPNNGVDNTCAIDAPKKKTFDISRVKEDHVVIGQDQVDSSVNLQNKIDNVMDLNNIPGNIESSSNIVQNRFTLIKGAEYSSMDGDQGILENSDLSCQEEINEIRENLLKLQQMKEKDSDDDDDDLKGMDLSKKVIIKNAEGKIIEETDISNEKNKDQKKNFEPGFSDETLSKNITNTDGSQVSDVTDSDGDSRSSSPTHKLIDDSLIIKKVDVSIDGSNLRTNINPDDDSHSLISSLVDEGFIRKSDQTQFMMIFSLLLKDFDIANGKRSISWLNDMEAGPQKTTLTDKEGPKDKCVDVTTIADKMMSGGNVLPPPASFNEILATQPELPAIDETSNIDKKKVVEFYSKIDNSRSHVLQ